MADEAQSQEPDDREPTPVRQAELQAAYEKNVAAGKAPYDHVAIRTRGELFWVLRERDWSVEADAGDKDRANLSGASFHGADLSGATLSGADLRGADLREANLTDAGLAFADLSGAYLRGANLSGAHFYNANLSGADLFGTNLSGAFLPTANLNGAHLVLANLSGAHLGDADLSGADLSQANLSGADLRDVTLGGAYLRAARMNADTNLTNAKLDARTRLADVVWNGVPVTRLNWQDVDTLGDEWVAHQAKDKEGKPKGKGTRLGEFQDAVLANRQVASLLRSQGLNEPADRFAYRAQLCQRRLLRLQRHYLRYLGSLFLWLTAGYGYKPMRSLIAYVVIICAFAGAYLLNAQFAAPHLTWDEALVLSISAFHGRGFFTSGISLSDTLARLAAGEAIIGLLIEITFIATFTQRFFAR